MRQELNRSQVRPAFLKIVPSAQVLAHDEPEQEWPWEGTSRCGGSTLPLRELPGKMWVLQKRPKNQLVCGTDSERFSE